MANVNEALRFLPPASFRGIEFPVVARSHGFQHSSARHKFQFRDDELIESLGRQNPTWRYTIPFHRGFARSQYDDLFPDRFAAFKIACLDKTGGELIDPIDGNRRVKVAEYAELLDVTRKSGVDVEVTFVQAPADQPAQQDFPSIPKAREAAVQFDEQVAEIYRLRQEAPPEPTVNPFDALAGIADQTNAAFNKVDASIRRVESEARNAEDSIERLREPKLAPAKRNARNLQRAAVDLLDSLSVNPGRPVRTHTVLFATGPKSLASFLQNTLAEFFRLNPRQVGKVTVEKGERVKYYADG